MKKFACSILYVYPCGITEAHGHTVEVIEAEYADQAEVVAEEVFTTRQTQKDFYRVVDVAVVELEGDAMTPEQTQACQAYLDRYVGTPEVLTLDTLPSEVPAVRDIPEGLAFQVGRTAYCRYDRDLWNLQTGRTLDRSSFLAKRANRLAIAQSVRAALEAA